MSSQPAKALKNKSARRQRRYPRFRVEFPVSVTVFAVGERQQLAGHCRDLSRGGAGLLIAAEIGMGEVASLEFALPGRPEPWAVRAVLRYRRGYHYGFEFLSLSSEQASVLSEYLPKWERADQDSGAELRGEAAPLR